MDFLVPDVERFAVLLCPLHFLALSLSFGGSDLLMLVEQGRRDARCREPVLMEEIAGDLCISSICILGVLFIHEVSMVLMRPIVLDDQFRLPM